MTDEKKLEAVERIIKNSIKLSSRGMIYEGEIIPLSKSILAALKQFEPEQLEVYLNGGLGINGAAYAVDYINPHGDPMCLLWAKTKQEAIDFCTKHGLKVINKETIK